MTMATPSTASRILGILPKLAPKRYLPCHSLNFNSMRLLCIDLTKTQCVNFTHRNSCLGHTDNITINRRHYFHQASQSGGMNIVSEKHVIFQNFDPFEACRRIRSLREAGHLNRDILHLVNAVTKELLRNNRLDEVLHFMDVLIQDQQQGTSRQVRMKALLSSTYAKVYQMFVRYTAEDKRVESFVEFLNLVDIGVSNYEFFQILRVASQVGDGELALVCYEQLKSSTKFVPCCGIAYGLLLQAHLNDVAMGNEVAMDNEVAMGNKVVIGNERNLNKNVLSTSLEELIHSLPSSDADVEQSLNDDFMLNFGKNVRNLHNSALSANFKTIIDEHPNDTLLMRYGNSYQQYDESSKNDRYNSDYSDLQQLSTTENFQLAPDDDPREKCDYGPDHNLKKEPIKQYVFGMDTKDHEDGSTQKNVSDSNGMKIGTSTPGEDSDGRMQCSSCGKSFKGQKGLKMHLSRSKTCKVK